MSHSVALISLGFTAIPPALLPSTTIAQFSNEFTETESSALPMTPTFGIRTIVS